jgi:signal transduction histidine kinase
MADLVIDLEAGRSGSLRDALASALGDPTLKVGYRVGQGYVDAAGRPLVLPPAPPRAMTRLQRAGEPLAVLVHDAAVLDDPGLTAAVEKAARLGAANAALQREVADQVRELRASRLRLLNAADEERARLEQRLRERVVARLSRLGDKLDGLDPGAREQLAGTLEDLETLSAGLHPGSRRNFAAALESLVARSPVPVDLRLTDVPLADEAATAAYFVCSEALANVVKYARAAQVTISLEVADDHVLVEVADDGRGGADPQAGTGLRGLSDRVEALGGTLAVDSPTGRGTRVTARLPLP